MILSPLDGVRRFYENLNDRERRLVLLLGGVVLLAVVGVPLFLLLRTNASLSSENQELRDALADLSSESDRIGELQASRARAEARYDTRAPALGGFLEEHAHRAGYDRPLQVTNEPNDDGELFVRRHVRAELPGVGLKTAIDMITAVENSRYPLAVESLRIEHFGAGDRYNVQLGVITFDRKEAAAAEDEEESDEPPTRMDGRAGPPRR